MDGSPKPLAMVYEFQRSQMAFAPDQHCKATKDYYAATRDYKHIEAPNLLKV